MTDGERRLVDILRSRQRELGMLDVPFAKHIGISQGHWSLLKGGKRGIGRRVARKILERFPELWRDIQDALLPRETAA